MTGKAIVETERLILREFVADDAEAFFALNSDPEVTRYTGDGGVKNVAEAREGLLTRPIADYAKYGYGRLACILKENGLLIGFAGLKYLDDLGDTDIGYRFMTAYWGRGLATEAAMAALDDGFQRLGLTRIIGLVEPENVASVRVLTKLGLRADGTVDYRGQNVAKYVIEVDEWKRARLTR